MGRGGLVQVTGQWSWGLGSIHPPPCVTTVSPPAWPQAPEGGKAEWRPEAKSGQPAPSHPTLRANLPQAADPRPQAQFDRKSGLRSTEATGLHPKGQSASWRPFPWPTDRALSPQQCPQVVVVCGNSMGGVQPWPCPLAFCVTLTCSHLSEPQMLWHKAIGFNQGRHAASPTLPLP